MNIIVTGGAGFIGSNFVHYTLKNRPEYEVTVIDKLTYAGNPDNLSSVLDKIEFVTGDICDRDLMDKLVAETDIVVHFAAESHNDNSLRNPWPFVETNVIGTYNILEAVRKHDKRLHHISTDEVFGDLELNDPNRFTEETPYNPSSPYSSTKASSDMLVRAWMRSFGIKATISNCSNNYGANHFPEKLIPLSINNIKHNKPIPIYGKGENIRDWLWVNDHARAIDTIFHTGKDGETYNIGGNNEWTNIDLIHKLCEIMDRKLNREAGTSAKLITFVTDRAGHDLRYAIDSSKLQRELGWKPSLQFEEGLEKTVDWYLSNQEWLDNVTSGQYQKYYEEQYTERK